MEFLIFRLYKKKLSILKKNKSLKIRIKEKTLISSQHNKLIKRTLHFKKENIALLPLNLTATFF